MTLSGRKSAGPPHGVSADEPDIEPPGPLVNRDDEHLPTRRQRHHRESRTTPSGTNQLGLARLRRRRPLAMSQRNPRSHPHQGRRERFMTGAGPRNQRREERYGRHPHNRQGRTPQDPSPCRPAPPEGIKRSARGAERAGRPLNGTSPQGCKRRRSAAALPEGTWMRAL